MQKKFLLVLILFGYCWEGTAQAVYGGKISFYVTDEKKSPIANATVALFSTKDSSLVKTSLSDTAGLAYFENIRYGKYQISISSKGYLTYTATGINLDSSHDDLHLGEIKLRLAPTTLQTVTIDSRKSFIEKQPDKFVVNVESSIVSSGATAMDLLERSPTVRVDADGNVSMSGKSGVNIMVDGKRLFLAGSDLANYLRNLSSSQIEKLEIITNPSSRYDAEGNAGIINIKLKKDKRMGINGNLSLSYAQGVYAKFNNSLSFNYRKNKLNIFGSYSYYNAEGFVASDLSRKFYSADTLNALFRQYSHAKVHPVVNNSRLGADFNITNSTTIGFLYTGYYSNILTGVTTPATIQDNTNKITSYINTINSQNDRINRSDFNLNLKKNIDTSGSELSVDLDYTHYNQLNKQKSATNYFNDLHEPAGEDLLLSGNLPALFDIYSIKSDYVHPVKSKNITIEAGIKMSYVKNSSDILYFLQDENGIQHPDSSRSNYFIYHENINAAYFTLSKDIGKWSFKAGLRAEHSYNKGDQVTLDTIFTRNYISFFPTFYVDKKIGGKNDLSFSYNRRLSRPQYPDLNPFRFFLDPYTYRIGNPLLQPEFTDNFQLSHIFDGKITTSFNYTHGSSAITPILLQDDATKVTYQTNENLSSYDLLDININSNFKITKWWSHNHNIDLYRNSYKGIINGQVETISQNCFGIQLNNSFTISPALTAEVNGLYNSASIFGLFHFDPSWTMSAGIQQFFWDRKGSIRLSVRDIFYTDQTRLDSKYQNVDLHLVRNRDTRTATLSFSYRFGKNSVTPSRRRNTGTEEERRRLGAGSNT